MTPTETREWARGYIRQFGWSVTPVWLQDDKNVCGCPAGPRCMTPGRHMVSGAGIARTEVDVTAVWNDDDKAVGIGVLTGSESDLLVLDVRADAMLTRARFRLHDYIPTQTTPSGGQHWFFKLGDDAIAGRYDVELISGVWVLGETAFAVLGPRSGYQWLGGPAGLVDVTVNPLPDELRVRLVQAGILSSADRVNRDEPWRAAPGAPLLGRQPRSYTRTGDVRRIVDHHGDRVLFTPEIGWRVWTENGWQGSGRALSLLKGRVLDLPDVHRREWRWLKKNGDDTEAKNAYKWASKSEHRPAMSIVSDLDADPRVLVPDASYWDAHGFLVGLPVGDGVGRVLDLRTSAVLRGEGLDARSLRISKQLGVDYGGERLMHYWSRATLFPKYIADLERANGEDWVRLLQRAAGASLYGQNGSDKLDDAVFVLKGPAGCGKSTFGECLNAVAGSYGKALNGNLIFGGKGNQEFQIAAVQGYRVLVLSEPKSGSRELDSEMLKALSGGDERTGRNPYGKQEVTFTPECSLWLMTNHPLEVDDDATWRRLKLFEFAASLDFNGEKADTRIRQALKSDRTELACALAWFLEGARLFDEEGWGGTSLWTSAGTDERAAHDGLTRFVTERVTVTGAVSDELPEMHLMSELEVWRMLTRDAVITESVARIKDGLVQRIERSGGTFDRKRRLYRKCVLNP